MTRKESFRGRRTVWIVNSKPAINPRPRAEILPIADFADCGLRVRAIATAEFRALRREFQALNFVTDLRQRHRAADGMTEKRAGVNRFAVRLRPGGVHDVGAADAGRKWKAARERFAEAESGIGNHVLFPGTRVRRQTIFRCDRSRCKSHRDEQRAVFVAKFAQQFQNPAAEC
jgi:hypothetical protein